MLENSAATRKSMQENQKLSVALTKIMSSADRNLLNLPSWIKPASV